MGLTSTILTATDTKASLKLETETGPDDVPNVMTKIVEENSP